MDVRLGDSGTHASPEPRWTDEEVVSLVRQGVVGVTGYPLDTVPATARLLDDLNLDSLKTTELAVQVGQRIGLGEPSLKNMGEATIESLAQALVAQLGERGPRAAPRRQAAWVRDFEVRFRPLSIFPERGSGPAASRAVVLGRLRGVLHEAVVASVRAAHATVEVYDRPDPAGLDVSSADALFVLLETGADDFDGQAWLAALLGVGRAFPRSATERPPRRKIVFMGQGDGRFGVADAALAPGAAFLGFANTVRLERPDLSVVAIDVSASWGATGSRVLEQLALLGSGVYGVTDHGALETLEAAPLLEVDYEPRDMDLTSSDVVIVTGGAKGITRACALALAGQRPMKFALVGRSAPGADIEEALQAFADVGAAAQYFRCDVSDHRAVEEMVFDVSSSLGPVTGVIHGAGLNRPALLGSATLEQAREEIAPKVGGVQALISALGEHSLKFFVGLSSIIGTTGMPGNAWYAYANDALNRHLQALARQRPDVVVQSVGFSVWEELGMGARLGTLGRLADLGIGAISPEEGTARFIRRVLSRSSSDHVIVTASVGALATWPRGPQPTLRPEGFLEELMEAEPGVSARARRRLSAKRDLFVAHHDYHGSLLLPTVFAVEGMLEAATLLCGEHEGFEVLEMSMPKPVVVSPGGETTIEIRARVLERATADGRPQVEAAILSEQDDFASPRFSATIVLGAGVVAPQRPPPQHTPMSLDPAELYRSIWFQGPSFRSIRSIHGLSAERVLVRCETAADGPAGSGLLSGNAYLRDALLQSSQLTIPDASALPVRIARWQVFDRTPRDRCWIDTEIVHYRDSELRARVACLDDDGNVLELVDNYDIRVLSLRPERPSLESLLQRARSAAVVTPQGAASRVPSAVLPESAPSRPTPPNGASDARQRAPVAPGASFGLQAAHARSLLAGRILTRYAPPQEQFQIRSDGHVRYVWRTSVGFKDVTRRTQQVLFTRYLDWMGHAREGALSEFTDLMMSEFASGKVGITTNRCDLQVEGPLRLGDTLEVQLYVAGADEREVTAGFEFFALRNGQLERVASGSMAASWVHVDGYGSGKAVVLPGYIQEFVESGQADASARSVGGRALRSLTTLATSYQAARQMLGLSGLRGAAQRLLGAAIFRPARGHDAREPPSDRWLPAAAPLRSLFQVEARRRVTPTLWRYKVSAGLEDSNVVGNVYFARFFAWQNRARDAYVESTMPGVLRDADLGEFIVTDVDLQFLREAMPFDDLVVELGLRRLTTQSVVFEVTFVREPDGRKLCRGSQTALWMRGGEGGGAEAADIPDEILKALVRACQASLPDPVARIPEGPNDNGARSDSHRHPWSVQP